MSAPCMDDIIVDFTPEAEVLPMKQESDSKPEPPRRKGGRKPLSATLEERKQRNREAQAAFRERRTEYIKELEDAIQVHKKNHRLLQEAHTTATDECLMLRYKNSLLERILLEKGVDVRAELYEKEHPSSVKSAKESHRSSHSSNVQPIGKKHRSENSRSIPNRVPEFHVRSNSVAHPSSHGAPPSHQSLNHSRKSHNTSSRPMMFHEKPIAPVVTVQRRQQAKRHRNSKGSSVHNTAVRIPHYLPPQKYIEHLEQECDAPLPNERHDDDDRDDQQYSQAHEYESYSPVEMDMVDDQGTSDFTSPESYLQALESPLDTRHQQVQFNAFPSQSMDKGGINGSVGDFTPITDLLHPYDALFDSDPFGLSASMNFPTLTHPQSSMDLSMSVRG
jgi:hypothetical protein